jgi:bifunctional UDP-N-acetylglucosamine pyrophosphorylase/glucosamine-1-phosphate N-acetyltransferase
MGTVLEDTVKVGNFVEIKKSRLGRGTKSGHLAYVGDATVGKNVNVSAGVVTANYDGKKKNETHIEDDAFVGTNSTLIAPVRVGSGAFVAAGSTITDDVPAEGLAIARERQIVKEGRAPHRKKKE